MSLVKKIAICTGLDENNNNQPIWETQNIGVDANNIILESPFLGQNNLQSILSSFLPNQGLNSTDCVLGLDQNGKIFSTGISVSALNQMYDYWAQQQEPIEPNEEEEPTDPNNNEGNENGSGENEGNENGSEGNEGEENGSGNENITVPTEPGNEEPEEP